MVDGKCHYRKVNGIVTVLFNGLTIPTGVGTYRMPEGYRPAYNAMTTISRAAMGIIDDTNLLFTVTVCSSSFSFPGAFMCYPAGETSVYGSITYPV